MRKRTLRRILLVTTLLALLPFSCKLRGEDLTNYSSQRETRYLNDNVKDYELNKMEYNFR